MKVLHLATQDKVGGGADAAYRLHCNMRSTGLDSCMVVLHKKSDDPDVVDVASHLSAVGKLRQSLYAIQQRLMWRLFHMSAYFYIDTPKVVSANRLVDMFPFRPDVIVAHWVSGFVNATTLRDLNRITGAPILWYFMDMAPLTGGCHYAFDCTGYTRQCGNCPQLGVWRGSVDMSHRQWQNKWSSFQETNITAVAASSWLRNQLELGSVFRNKRHETILLGMDVDVFKPVPQVAARAMLGLPADRKIIFFGASNIHEDRKGIVYLVDALSQLHALLNTNPDLRGNILIVTAGLGKNAEQLKIPFEHRHIGLLQGNDKLAAAYQSADIFVNASIEDSGPMMINESILCGTPVVSFDMGVAPDLVHTGRTGYRARLKDSADMAAGMLRLLEMDDNSTQAMRMECRTLGVQLCHPDVQVRAFMDLFVSDSRSLKGTV
jgi:glycosyltransferase involved in cell wall biosynthesis